MKKIAVKTYDLRKKNQKSGPEGGPLRFAFLTDLHSVENGRENRLLLRALEQAAPDAVLCGGDMIVGRPGQSPAIALRLMEEMRRRWPVVHAMGNHEYRAKIYPGNYGSLYRDYREGLERCGVIFLDNGSAELSLRGRSVRVYGLSLGREFYQRFTRRLLSQQEIRRAIGAPDRGETSVLLAHNPIYLRAYLEWGADLVLCGHYHGGVMRLGEHRGLVSPDFRVFPREAHGLFRGEKGYGIVSAGIGEHTIPVRIFNPRELVLFTI